MTRRETSASVSCEGGARGVLRHVVVVVVVSRRHRSSTTTMGSALERLVFVRALFFTGLPVMVVVVVIFYLTRVHDFHDVTARCRSVMICSYTYAYCTP